jgi:hypothetical protein
MISIISLEHAFGRGALDDLMRRGFARREMLRVAALLGAGAALRRRRGAASHRGRAHHDDPRVRHAPQGPARASGPDGAEPVEPTHRHPRRRDAVDRADRAPRVGAPPHHYWIRHDRDRRRHVGANPQCCDPIARDQAHRADAGKLAGSLRPVVRQTIEPASVGRRRELLQVRHEHLAVLASGRSTGRPSHGSLHFPSSPFGRSRDNRESGGYARGGFTWRCS